MTDEFAAYRRSTAGISYTDVGQGPITRLAGDSDGVAFMSALLSSMTPDQLAPITPLLRRCETPTVIPGAKKVTEMPRVRLFFPDERAAELTAALTTHWAENG